ncbi:MAG TPA: helix-turn-helix domain-containing protein [Solirubrobacterales bacterium]|nr:helix-turn-helix domain-containing protein [Solirubrobacterales bacterium]
MAAAKKDDDNRYLLQALRHPLRRDLLKMAIERGEVSPIRAAREVETPVSTVSYHLRELAKVGAVASDGDEPGTGPLEQVYTADEAMRRIPSVREAIGLPPEEESRDSL